MPMQNGLCGDAASNDPSCGPGSVEGSRRLQGLKHVPTEIVWHAKVPDSLPSGYATGVVDGIGRSGKLYGLIMRYIGLLCTSLRMP
ncbi:Hypothetical protein FKW44_019336 [Caligus rogercresseyi]|uniref:Uncharacterized protein n=1 Tax=Caligus rogercresseyi TaxID=217165 RepID=A0A7T8GVR6_CALRO|nr:Hypothetical protein FKW44_019336 [Caligus rogercresseyi]